MKVFEVKVLHRLLFLLAVLAVSASCSRPERNQDAEQLSASTRSQHESLYDQGKTSACWIYAMLSCIEREQLRYGDSVTLSRQWLMARLMEEQTRDYRLTEGTRPISMRGVGPEVLRLISYYGLIPYVQEKTHITNSNVLERRLRLLAEQHILTAKEFDSRLQDLLPQFTVGMTQTSEEHPGQYTNPDDASFYYYSMRYTPRSFAESIMYHQQWNFYAYSPHHPLGARFALEIPDNHRYHEYTNANMKDIKRMVIASVSHGHPVYWEYGKNHTSSHAMAIIGMKKDKEGNPVFICQNSYGKSWGTNGCCTVTLSRFEKLTCNVGIISY